MDDGAYKRCSSYWAIKMNPSINFISCVMNIYLTSNFVCLSAMKNGDILKILLPLV